MDCNELILQAKTFLNRSQTSLVHHDKNFAQADRIIRNLCNRLEKIAAKSDAGHLAVDELSCHNRKISTNERKMSSATERSVHFGSMILSVDNDDPTAQHFHHKRREAVVFALLKAIPHLLLFMVCLSYIVASYYLLCSIDKAFSTLAPFEVYPLLVNSYLRPGILTARPQKQRTRAAFSVMIVLGIAFLSALTGNVGRLATEAYCFLKPKVVKLIYDKVIPRPQRIDLAVLLYALTLFNILAIVIYNLIDDAIEIIDVFYFFMLNTMGGGFGDVNPRLTSFSDLMVYSILVLLALTTMNAISITVSLVFQRFVQEKSLLLIAKIKNLYCNKIL